MRTSDHICVLLSGGVDSALCLQMALEIDPATVAVFVDYGQPSVNEERAAVYRVCRAFEVEPVVTTASIDCSALTGDGPCVVPGRNAMLYATALPVARQAGCSVVWFGANADDQQDYPDCRQGWIDAVSLPDCRLDAPLLRLSKREIVQRADRLVELCWTCYQPVFGRPCETCAACRRLALARWIAERRQE